MTTKEYLSQIYLLNVAEKGKNRQPDQSPEKSATYPDLKDAVS